MTRRAQIGIGTFRITSRNPEHLSTLDWALENGATAIDTALSYMNGEAQAAASRAYAHLDESVRSEVPWITKFGYIQGDLRDRVLARAEQGGSVFSTHRINDYTEYSLDPTFLEEALSLTLEKLPPQAQPIILIQSPEILQQRLDDYAQFHTALTGACDFLNTQTELGRIGGFGISSQTLVDPLGVESHLSLEALMEDAPGMKFIAFPLNLFEGEATYEPLFQERTLLDTAQRYGLATLAQRPFLARGDQPMRLFSHPLSGIEEGVVFDELKTALDQALSVETKTGANWAHRIRKNLESLMHFEKWRNIRAFEIEPELSLLAASSECESYLTAMQRLLEAMDAYSALSITQDSKHLTAFLDQIVPDLRAEPSLHRKALAVYRAIPGLDYVLAGMRRRSQAQDLLAPARVELTADQALRVLKEIALNISAPSH